MAEILFTDATGAATLQSSWPVPADRFRNWTPYQRPIGEGAHGLGDGQRYQYQFRTDHGASLEMPGIVNTDLAIALRFQAHLLGGGVCEVRTEDTLASVYPTCGLAPDGDVEITLEDRAMLEYTVRVTVIDVAASPVPMVCEY